MPPRCDYSWSGNVCAFHPRPGQHTKDVGDWQLRLSVVLYAR